ncbi:acyltransferase [Purpureocillium lavendulum]|uniref:1-acyl-sn-glycerol-3-phosphate acyltransferase n=1 Tax=Purpureocillium lavendulum TaxID=1247861 RepID=A0AB34G4P5_9HYPO|nr:acyltransferase [Purpureocillium lavendulum]
MPITAVTAAMSSLLSYLAKFLVGYLALTVFLYALAAVAAVPRAGFVARVLAAYLSLVACALFGAVASALLTLLGHQQISQWVTARSFHYLMRLTTGVAFEVDDPRDVLGSTRPAVFIGNHQTELDVLMLGAMFPKYCSVTAKSDLKHVPFLGWFMRLSGSIFIDRKNSKDARDAMAGAAQEIRAKRQSVYMFPEGTRSYTKEPALLPFKKGAFHLAVQAGVPVVPVVVANYSHVLYLKKLVFNAGTIPIKVLDPIPTKNLTSADVDELARSTRELMLKELVTLSAKAKGQPIPVPAANDSVPKAVSSGADIKP